MGFFNQSKQDQRSMERMVIIFYSLYTINLYIGMIRLGVKLWIPIVMLVLGACIAFKGNLIPFTR